jgi:hypothetical protein
VTGRRALAMAGRGMRYRGGRPRRARFRRRLRGRGGGVVWVPAGARGCAVLVHRDGRSGQALRSARRTGKRFRPRGRHSLVSPAVGGRVGSHGGRGRTSKGVWRAALRVIYGPRIAAHSRGRTADVGHEGTTPRWRRTGKRAHVFCIVPSCEIGGERQRRLPDPAWPPMRRPRCVRRSAGEYCALCGPA